MVSKGVVQIEPILVTEVVLPSGRVICMGYVKFETICKIVEYGFL